MEARDGLFESRDPDEEQKFESNSNFEDGCESGEDKGILEDIYTVSILL